ncbi:MAG: hypothetical protein IRZ21_06355 [Thermoleophilaceae bacterium]|nr:hypothetical protein [Thermoleophilaceae bacterium]
MKVEAMVVFRLQAGSLAEAGEIVDDVLARARERDDVEVGQVAVATPPGATPVTLPPVSTSGQYPGVPYTPGAEGSEGDGPA